MFLGREHAIWNAEIKRVIREMQNIQFYAKIIKDGEHYNNK